MQDLMFLAAIWSCLGCGGGEVAEPTLDIFSGEFVRHAMERAFDWQIEHIVYSAPLPDGGFQDVSDTEWVRGAFFSGVMAAAESASRATGRTLEAA